MRRSRIRRGKRLAVRRTAPRRVASPLPLPTGEPVRAEDVREPGVAFGPQAELCRRTTCSACWALSRRSPWWLIDWSQLPAAPEGRHSEAHHEPPRGLGVASEDDDTIPLCPHHHRTGPAFAVRHRMGAREFYSAVGIGDYLRVRDELRRRVQSSAACAAEGEGGARSAPAALVPDVGEPGPGDGVQAPASLKSAGTR